MNANYVQATTYSDGDDDREIAVPSSLLQMCFGAVVRSANTRTRLGYVVPPRSLSDANIDDKAALYKYKDLLEAATVWVRGLCSFDDVLDYLLDDMVLKIVPRELEIHILFYMLLHDIGVFV